MQPIELSGYDAVRSGFARSRSRAGKPPLAIDLGLSSRYHYALFAAPGSGVVLETV